MKNLPLGLMAIIILPVLFFVGGTVSVLAALVFLMGGFANQNSNAVTYAASKNNFNPVYQLYSAPPPVLGTFTSRVGTADSRALTLEQFFANYHSPLAQYADVFVSVADKYSLPWQLLPAISMQESTGGKNVPEDCYNPFGWGIHVRGTLCFESWTQGIEQVAKGFKEKYIDNGLVTIDQIMRKYNPTSYNRDGSWGSGVQFFLNIIESFNTP